MADTAQITTKLKLDGKEFNKGTAAAAATVAKLGAAAVGLQVALKAAALVTANFQDDMIKTARIAGTNAKNFSELALAAEQGGVDMTFMSKALGKLAAPAGKGEKALKDLGVSITDNNGNLKDSTKTFKEVSEKIAAIKNPAEKTAIAIDLFGGSGAKLVNVLNNGAAGLDAYAEKAAKLGVVVSEKAGVAAEIFNDRMDDLGKSVKGVVFAVGESVIAFDNQFNVTEGLIEIFTTLSAGWRELSEDTREFIVGMVAATAAVGGLALAVVAFIKLKPLIKSFFTTLTANPVTIALVALSVAVIAVAASIKKNWSQMANIIEPLGRVFSNLSDTITKAFEPIKNLVAQLGGSADKVDELGDNIDRARGKLDLFGSTAKFIFGLFASTITVVGTLVEALAVSFSSTSSKLNSIVSITKALISGNKKEIKKAFLESLEVAKGTNAKMEEIGRRTTANLAEIWSKPFVFDIDTSQVEKANEVIAETTKKTEAASGSTKEFESQLQKLIKAYEKAGSSAERVIGGANIAKFFADQAKLVVNQFTQISAIVAADQARELEVLNRNFQVKLNRLKEQQAEEREIFQIEGEDRLAALEGAFQSEIDALERAEAKRLRVIERGANQRLLALNEEFQKIKEIEDQKFQFFLENEAKKFEAEQAVILAKAFDEEQRKINERLLLEDFNNFIENETERHEQTLSELESNFLNDKKLSNDQFIDDKAKAQTKSDKEIEKLTKQRDAALLKAQEGFADGFTDIIDAQNKEEKRLAKENLLANWKAEKQQFQQTKTLRKLEIGVAAAAAAAAVVAQQVALFGPFGFASGGALAATMLGIAAARIDQIDSLKPVKPAALLAEGGVLTGPSHAQGGIAANVEGGETVIDKFRTSEFLSKFDSMRSGSSVVVNFGEGAIVINGASEDLTEDFLDNLGSALAERMEREGLISNLT